LLNKAEYNSDFLEVAYILDIQTGMVAVIEFIKVPIFITLWFEKILELSWSQFF